MASGWDGSGNVNNSDGVRSGRTVCVQERTAPVDATAENFDAMFGTMCDSIENCLALDGQNSPTANISMNSHKFTSMTTGSALTDSVAASQLVNSSLIWGGTSGGSANAQTLTLSIAPAAYAAGQMFLFKAGYSNSAACTINVNSLGAKDVYKLSYNGVVNTTVGDIIANLVHLIAYDGTRFLLLNTIPQVLSNSSGDIEIKAQSGRGIYLIIGDTTYWIGNSSGIYPNADLSYNLGTSTKRLASVYTQGIEDGTGIQTVSATGSTQGTAAAITKQFVYASPEPGASGVILPNNSIVGREIYVCNTDTIADGDDLAVYPYSGGSIWPLSTNLPGVISPENSCMFKCVSTNNWIMIGWHDIA